MPYTVLTSFDLFYDNINLAGDHRDTANRRKDDIISKLKKNFEIIDSFSTGSIPKFTALKQYADLDIFVVLKSKHIQGKTPTQLLRDLRQSLAEWRTGARKNGQAVTLYYKTWPNVDIVPASQGFNGSGNFSHYNIPNSNTDSWLKSNPKIHTANIEAHSRTSGPNFRRIIKMVKHWNRIHGDYLQSYHIEALAIQALNNNLSDLTWSIFKFFEKSKELLQNYLWYDNGFADDYLDFSARQEVCSRFEVATDKSRRAWFLTYGSNNDHKSAIEIWRQIFGDKFPVYG